MDNTTTSTTKRAIKRALAIAIIVALLGGIAFAGAAGFALGSERVSPTPTVAEPVTTTTRPEPPRPATEPGTVSSENTPLYPQDWDCHTEGDHHCGDLELGA